MCVCVCVCVCVDTQNLVVTHLMRNLLHIVHVYWSKSSNYTEYRMINLPYRKYYIYTVVCSNKHTNYFSPGSEKDARR